MSYITFQLKKYVKNYVAQHSREVGKQKCIIQKNTVHSHDLHDETAAVERASDFRSPMEMSAPARLFHLTRVDHVALNGIVNNVRSCQGELVFIDDVRRYGSYRVLLRARARALSVPNGQDVTTARVATPREARLPGFMSWRSVRHAVRKRTGEWTREMGKTL